MKKLVCSVLVFATASLALASTLALTIDADADSAGEVSSFTTQDCNSCSYDLNGDSYLCPEDVGGYVTLLSGYAANYYYISPTDPDWDPCLDANGDGYLGPEDVGKLVSFLSGISFPWPFCIECAWASFP